MSTTYKEFLSSNLYTSNVSYTVQSDPVSCDGIDGIMVVGTADAVSMPNVAYASATDIDATANTFSGAHSFLTGQVVQISTDTALPTPLVAATDYYVIVVDATTIKLASSLAFAKAGTAINITDAGTGTQTIAASTTGTCDLSLMVSIDGSIFVPYAAATTLTSAGVYIAIDRPKFQYFYTKLTITDNQFTVNVKYLFKDFFNDLK